MASVIGVCSVFSAAVPVRPWDKYPRSRRTLEVVGRFRVEVVITASVTVDGRVVSNPHFCHRQ